MKACPSLLAASTLLCVTLSGQVSPTAFTNFESSQTNPIRTSADGTRLYALNTPDNRVSVFDLTIPAAPALIAEIPVGIEPVSVNVNPQNADELWVVNQESDSVSVVSIAKGIVTDTIACKDEPADVVFAGANAFVSISRSNTINVYSIATHTLVKSIPVFGGSPRALAVSANGATLYAAFAISGNRSTILPSNVAPPQPKPNNTALPPAPQTGLIINVTDPSWTWFIKYKIPDNDVVAIDTTALTVKRYYSGVGTINLGLAIRPATGDLFIANTDSRNLIRFEPNLRGHWVDNRITAVKISTGTVTPYDLNPGIDYTVLPNTAALSTALAQPTAIVFDPSGLFLWIAAFGTDRVAKVSPTGKVLNMIEIGAATGSQVDPVNKKGPRGLALNAKAKTLYVLNRISNTISVVSTTQNLVTSEIPTGTFDPTPSVIRAGRGYLYDAKLSGNGTGACSSCHPDADMDHLAWDLGDPNGSMVTVVSAGLSYNEHPMKGPMVTRSLRGLGNLNPLHWRGDIPDFTGFNVIFDALMGGAQIGSSNMADYEAFINTVVFQPNPNQNLDRSLPTSLNGGNAVNGAVDFQSLGNVGTGSQTCNSCHLSTPGPGSNLTVIQRSNLAQPFKIPALRNVYQKLTMSQTAGTSSIDGFGVSSDGEIASLPDVFAQAVLGGFTGNPQSKADIAAFVLSFDNGTAPAVGYTRTVMPANATDPGIASDWATLQGQAAASNIDLIVKGTINGVLHGLLYQPAAGTYQLDVTGAPSYTQAQLLAYVASGDTLSVMGVPPGSGVRMGIDRNLDGVLDGDQ